ncbi:putative GCN5-related N-acetyltransferase [Methylobacterium sp. GXF4]|jgi:GNAT superfamily N-acetyltransferase|uniref:GNAT family N-acetyltransferase n=1 Tax=Methylobacterium sp. GXF4 TaxID=1096546 RepID=UPI0002697D45|nr:GNAT family N-acetyltransferase [Methylobacterium sp. GXF4]EIZ82283.1 putative GCN5-related N-acetyltransferase [Methylobacterium sp. GXF4]
MTASTITISTEADAAAKIVEDGLNAFNALHNGPDPTKPLWFICRDDQGTVLGGLQGFIQWDWFAIAMLWVREEHRGRGIGTRLLTEAEQEARKRGCIKFRLGTMTFQAPEFYKRFGYVEIGRMDDLPPGHSYIWMTKILPA